MKKKRQSHFGVMINWTRFRWHFQNTKKNIKMGAMVCNFNCLLLPLFFAQLLFVPLNCPSHFWTWQYPVGLYGPLEALWYLAQQLLELWTTCLKSSGGLKSIQQDSISGIITVVTLAWCLLLVSWSWQGTWRYQIAMFNRKGNTSTYINCPLFCAFLGVTNKIRAWLHYKHTVVCGFSLNRK